MRDKTEAPYRGGRENTYDHRLRLVQEVARVKSSCLPLDMESNKVMNKSKRTRTKLIRKTKKVHQLSIVAIA